jgi:hypothetical protein
MTDWAHAMMVMSQVLSTLVFVFFPRELKFLNIFLNHQAKTLMCDEKVGGGQDILCGKLPCYDIYRTKDGHIAVGALEPKFWTALCKVTQPMYWTFFLLINHDSQKLESMIS